MNTDAFWDLANRRYQMYENRLITGEITPTGDPILDRNRFTNTFRASDRISQRLLRIQKDGPMNVKSQVLRTLLFKVFNREQTWDLLESEFGSIDSSTWDPDRAKTILDAAPRPLFGGAYIMANRLLEGMPKHHFYIDLVDYVVNSYVPVLESSRDLSGLFNHLFNLRGIGRFLAYQYAIDLNYLPRFSFSENSMTVAGPGAARGLEKLLGDSSMLNYRIRQLWEERERGPLLLGKREMHLIDVQNMLCEYDKYTREQAGEKGKRMKQRYTPDPRPLPDPIWPKNWDM